MLADLRIRNFYLEFDRLTFLEASNGGGGDGAREEIRL